MSLIGLAMLVIGLVLAIHVLFWLGVIVLVIGLVADGTFYYRHRGGSRVP